MAWKPTFKVAFRRRRKGKTDYRKRLALLKSGKPRFVVRRTNKRLIAQLFEFDRAGDRVRVSADSKELARYGWNASHTSTPAAYLTGFLCGLKSMKEGVREAVLDLGLITPVHGSTPFAVLKGAVDAGLSIPHEAKAFPKEERLKGQHIVDFASKLNEEQLKKQFSECLKRGFKPKELTALFEKTKQAMAEELKVKA